MSKTFNNSIETINLSKITSNEVTGNQDFEAKRGIIKNTVTALTGLVLATTINLATAQDKEITSKDKQENPELSANPFQLSQTKGEQYAETGEVKTDGVKVEEDKELLAECDKDGNTVINGKEVLCKIQYKIKKNKEKIAASNEKIAEYEQINKEALKKSAEADKEMIIAEKELAKSKKLLDQKTQDLDKLKQQIRGQLELEPDEKVRKEITGRLLKLGK